ncbi:hypothetical protein, partial [Streptococcus pyogenes]|uniref:hypothetical protein n=1 Tax=Streptococcus pyogenes TaxID=1314 RepID=UPI0027DAB595
KQVGQRRSKEKSEAVETYVEKLVWWEWGGGNISRKLCRESLFWGSQKPKTNQERLGGRVRGVEEKGSKEY